MKNGIFEVGDRIICVRWNDGHYMGPKWTRGDTGIVVEHEGNSASSVLVRFDKLYGPADDFWSQHGWVAHAYMDLLPEQVVKQLRPKTRLIVLE